MNPIDFSPYIKEIGRGARGARGLSYDDARASFSALLKGDVSDVQLGAWWLAQRIKGETSEELHAFVDAMHDAVAWQIEATSEERPLVVLPCYNGARQLPNLTALLAHALIVRKFDVLMQGVIADPSRETTYSICHALGVPIAESKSTAQAALSEQHQTFVPIGAIHPKLATLLARRWQIGVRSVPHTVAKLLNPSTQPVFHIVALTHGDYIERMTAHLQTHRLSGAVFRGCEGEPVLHPKRKVEVRLFRKGESLIREWPGVESHDLPDTCDAATTVAYIREVIGGARPMPAWIDWLAQEMHLLAHDNDNENSKDSKLAR
jgi:anthranilate phosphoribosyltransferase